MKFSAMDKVPSCMLHNVTFKGKYKVNELIGHPRADASVCIPFGPQ